MRILARPSLLPLMVALALLVPAPQVLARSTSLLPGAQVSYDFKTSLRYPLPNGTFYQAHDNRFTVDVKSVDESVVPGIIGYVETFTLYNDTAVDQSINGTTPFFDPYDNRTYAGNIGFYPFTYTDVASGSRTNLPVSISVRTPEGGTLTNINMVNVTVTRTSTRINVVVAVGFGQHVQPSFMEMSYDESTGVLLHGSANFSIGLTTRGFTYDLLSYTPGTPTPFPLVGYIMIGVFMVIAVAAAADWTLRGRRGRKKFKGVSR